MHIDIQKIRRVFQAAISLGPTGPGIETVSLSNLFNSNTSLETFFSKLFYAALAIGAILAVLRLGSAGFIYMTSDVLPSHKRATEMIQQTVLGLLLLLSVWLILNQINPGILKLNILQNIKPVPTVTGQQTQAPAPTAPEYCYTPLAGGETCGFTTKQACDSSWAIFGSACYLKGSK